MLIVPSLHPSLLLRASEEAAGQAKFNMVVVDDFKRAASLLTRRPVWDESAIWRTDSAGRTMPLFPTPQEVYEFFAVLASLNQQAQRIEQAVVLGVDVETTGNTPFDCNLINIGFGYEYVDHTGRTCTRVLNVPVLRQGGAHYWSPGDEASVFSLVKWALAQPWLPKVMHNGAFDCAVLWAHHMPVHGWAHDTMQAHHVLEAELPQNLGFVASRYLEGRYWKDDVKGGTGWLDLPDVTLRSYNLRDILSTLRVLPPMLGEIALRGQEDLYQTEMGVVRLMLRASMRGMLVDQQRRDSLALDKDGKHLGLRPQLEAQRAKAHADLLAVGGAGFDPGKPAQLRWLLFDKLGMPVVKETATGLAATDREALMLLELVADQPVQKHVLKALVKLRQAEKFLSTFIEGLHIGADWRFRPMWKLLPVTGRLGSSPNAQNLPMLLRRIFRAPVGSKLVGIDLSQAELRLIGYYANEPSLLEMYGNDINVHTVNAALIFKMLCPPDKTDNTNAQTDAYIARMAKNLLGADSSTFPVAPSKKWKSVRTLAKNAEFGQAYGAEPETWHKVLRSKRDPDTSELMFPDLMLSEVQAIAVLWRKTLRKGVVAWWSVIEQATKAQGYYRCPLSGRRRNFREGFKRNEMLNTPIQMGIASRMNKLALVIQDIFDRETGGEALIIQQVHDALTVESPDDYAKRAGQVMQQVLSAPFDIPAAPGITPHKDARLPANAPAIDDYLDKT